MWGKRRYTGFAVFGAIVIVMLAFAGPVTAKESGQVKMISDMEKMSQGEDPILMLGGEKTRGLLSKYGKYIYPIRENFKKAVSDDELSIKIQVLAKEMLNDEELQHILDEMKKAKDNDTFLELMKEYRNRVIELRSFEEFREYIERVYPGLEESLMEWPEEMIENNDEDLLFDSIEEIAEGLEGLNIELVLPNGLIPTFASPPSEQSLIPFLSNDTEEKLKQGLDPEDIEAFLRYVSTYGLPKIDRNIEVAGAIKLEPVVQPTVGVGDLLNELLEDLENLLWDIFVFFVGLVVTAFTVAAMIGSLAIGSILGMWGTALLILGFITFLTMGAVAAATFFGYIDGDIGSAIVRLLFWGALFNWALAGLLKGCRLLFVFTALLAFLAIFLELLFEGWKFWEIWQDLKEIWRDLEEIRGGGEDEK